MRYLEAPALDPGPCDERSIFMAGGIQGCPQWQTRLVRLLRAEDVLLLNPRRAVWSMERDSAEEQIAWEHRHLRRASAISFWFPAETLCPIVLYELGAWSMTEKQLFVGTHPDYARRLDVALQTALVRPDIVLAHSLTALAAQIQEWLAKKPELTGDSLG